MTSPMRQHSLVIAHCSAVATRRGAHGSCPKRSFPEDQQGAAVEHVSAERRVSVVRGGGVRVGLVPGASEDNGSCSVIWWPRRARDRRNLVVCKAAPVCATRRGSSRSGAPAEYVVTGCSMSCKSIYQHHG